MVEAAIDGLVADIMDNVAEGARDEWIRLAMESDLGSTKQEYIDSIGPVEAPSATERTIELNGWLANALEGGSPAFDMKPGLLKGADHRVIPMMYGKTGNNSGLAALPTQVFNKAKKLKMGERISTKMGKSKYEGLQKTVVGKTGPVNDAFIKFRTVSVNSPADSWIHPGLSPLNLEDQVRSHIESNIDKYIGDI
jgi:hypothetical protein